MKKVLVTGGSGYIGSVVALRLIERGYDVTIFDNLERGHRENIDRLTDWGIGGLTDCKDGDGQSVNRSIRQSVNGSEGRLSRFIQGDLRNAGEIEAAMEVVRPEAVLHFAAYALVGESMADPMMYFRNNVGGGVNLLAAMEKVGCKRIIFSSTCATYGQPETLPIEETMPQRPTNPYGHSKLMFEKMAIWLQQNKGLQPTFLRYFNACGAVGEFGEDHEPETHIIPNVLKVALGQRPCVKVFGNDYPTRDGTCIRDYVHLEDLASAHILALEKGAVGAYNLGTGHGISVMEIVEACRQVTGHPIPVEMCARRPGDPAELYASGRKAREELGWNPTHSDVMAIVKDAWAFHQAHPQGVKSDAV